MTQKGFSVDLNKCFGCESCTIACKSENNTDINVNWRWVMKVEGGNYPKLQKYCVTLACNHCEEPACLKACPVEGAIVKREKDGIVYIDNDKCIGCKKCIWACPYGAPQYNSTTEKVEKCHMCMHRIDAGLQPACVDTCVGRALSYDDLDTLKADTDLTADIAGLPNSEMTKPSTLYKDIK